MNNLAKQNADSVRYLGKRHNRLIKGRLNKYKNTLLQF